MRISYCLEMSHSKKNKSKAQTLQPPEYDLSTALHSLNRRNPQIYGTAERTSTEVKIGSVNITYANSSETDTNTSNSLSHGYASEQYVESLVNNLKAEQSNSHLQLRSEINERIDNVDRRKISRSGFWIGMGIAVSFLTALYFYKTQKIESSIMNVDQSVTVLEGRVENLDKTIGEINLTKRIDALQDSIAVLHQGNTASGSSNNTTKSK